MRVALMSVLLLVGSVASWFMLLHPAWLVWQARHWTATPCQITESRVTSSRVSGHDSSDRDRTVHGVAIRFRYVVGGREYESSRWAFLVGLESSGRSGKQATVEHYPSGRVVTGWVDPENPEEAVLNRNFTGTMLLGVFPLLMALVGLLGVMPAFVLEPLGRRLESLVPKGPKEQPDTSLRRPPTKAADEETHGFQAALVLTGLAIWNVLAAIGDEVSNLGALGVNAVVLGALTYGYRRRIVACAFGLLAWPTVVVVMGVVSYVKPEVATGLTGELAMMGALALLPVLQATFAFAQGALTVSWIMVPVAVMLYRGTRRMIAGRPFPTAAAALVGVPSALLLLATFYPLVGIGLAEREGAERASMTDDQITAALAGDSTTARQRACQAAQGRGVVPPALAQALLSVLGDPDQTVRGTCLSALMSATASAQEVVPRAMALTKDPSAYVRMTAVRTIGALGVASRDAASLGAVLSLAGDPDPQVRQAALGAVRPFGPEGTPALPYLRAALRDGQGDVRQEAAGVLGAMGPAAAEAASDLARMVDVEKEERVRQEALGALQALGKLAIEARPAIVRALSAADVNTRVSALEALVAIAPDAPTLVDALRPLVHDKDLDVRKTALARLSDLGPRAVGAVPDLVALLSDEAIFIRVTAVDLLGAIGPPARAALPRLRQMATEKIISDESEARLLPDSVARAIERIEGRTAADR